MTFRYQRRLGRICSRHLLGLVAIDDQLIAYLGTALENRVGRQFNYAFSPKIGPQDPERSEQLPNPYNLELPVNHDNIECEQHSEGMDRV